MSRSAGTEAPGEDADRFSSSLRAVGGRVRERRREQGISLRDLAKRSQLSSSFLSLVERGECSLSLTSLFAISHALQISPTDLIGPAEPGPAQPRDFSLWRASALSENPTMVVGEREYFRLPGPLDDPVLDPLFFRIRPTTTVAPLATHEGEEFAYILKGSLWIRIRNHEVTLNAGDAIHFSSQTPHSIANLTQEPVETIWVSAHVAATNPPAGPSTTERR